MVTITCPHCGLNLLLPDDLRGRPVACSGCKQVLDTTAAEEVPITTAPAPRPTPRDDPPEREAPRRRPARRDASFDIDDDDRRPDPKASLGFCRGLMGGAGIVSVLGGCFAILLELVEATMLPRTPPPDVFLWMVFISGGMMALAVVPAIFFFVSVAPLARREGYGLVMTASILGLVCGIIQLCCCGGIHLVILTAAARQANAQVPLVVLGLFAQVVPGLLNLVAGIVLLATLNNWRVVHEFRRASRSRYNRDENDWSRRRR